MDSMLFRQYYKKHACFLLSRIRFQIAGVYFAD
jgi:hypothetical protein